MTQAKLRTDPSNQSNPQPLPQQILGAQIIVNQFKAHDIERLHVYPGGTIAPILDIAVTDKLDIYCARHEQGAGYAALAAARISGRPQVVMVTSGPGVTNLVTCIADAYFDSTPLIVITGQVGTADLQRDPSLRQRGFQEVDSVALLKPVTKAQFLPTRTADLPQILNDAFRIAASGRPGPVLIDMPMDVQRSSAEVGSLPAADQLEPAPQVTPTDIQAVVDALCKARRPLLIAGQGVLLARAQDALRDVLARAPMPVSHSLLGLGALPSSAPLALGFHGHTGNQAAGVAIQEADYLLVVGSRLDVRQTGTLVKEFAPAARIIRIELDATEIDHARVRVDQTLRGDVRDVLRDFADALANASVPDWSTWHARIAELKQTHALRWSDNDRLKPQQIIETVARLTAGATVDVVSGVGSHQQWVARHFDFDYPKRRWLTSGGHGAMGYDLPTAIGAQLYDPGRRVLCFVGDGSLQMNIQELAALGEHGFPVKIIVLDNHRLGIVSQFQNLNWQSDPTCGNKWNPDFAVIARAYGIAGLKLENPALCEQQVKNLLATPGPALLHCVIDEAEDVVPMLLANQRLDRMWPDGD